VVRRATDDRDVIGAGGDEPTAVVLGERGAGIGDPARERSGSPTRPWMQDSNGDRRHRSSLAGPSAPADRGWPDTGDMSERRVRAYVGLGANLGDAEATLTEAVRAL